MKQRVLQGGSIDDFAALLRRGELTCVDLCRQCLAEIDARDQQLQAWVVVDRDGALERAQQLDAELQRGDDRGALHGIPIGIKDIIDVAGQPTAAGFAPWRDRVAQHDATLVARLRDAGAVILGKTVTTQFAGFDPPETCNPWHSERTPGGSSSGSAAAVATGMCRAAVGTQTGGSIIRPASYCGVVGFKPTFGRVATAGVFPVAATLDHAGPMGRCAADVGVMFEAMAGQSRVAGGRGGGAAAFAAGTGGVMQSAPQLPTVSGLCLGRLRGYFEARAEADMLLALDGALSALGAAGAEVFDVALPAMFDEVVKHHHTIMAVEAAQVHRDRLAQCPGEYLPGVMALVREGVDTPQSEYEQARAYQSALREAMASCFAAVDALLMPATPGAAPDRATTGDPVFNLPWSLTGHPALSLPIARSSDGLPLAIQLVGWHGGDEALIDTAVRVERVLLSIANHAGPESAT